MLLRAIESLEESVNGLLIGFGSGCEARLVHAIVDEVIRPRIGLVNLGAQVCRVERDGAVLFIHEVVKLDVSESRKRE